MRSANFVFTELHAVDASKERAFYSVLFGSQFEDMPAGQGRYTFIKSGGETVGGIENSGRAPTRWLPYVGVTNVKAATAKARSLGATIDVDAQAVGDMGTMSVLLDPAGARIALWEAKGPGKK